jgi:hypothetical protein
MKSQALKVTSEPCDKNLVTKMWVTINNNTLLTEWLSEFLKLAKIVMVSILKYVEDECTFSMFAFMKISYTIGWDLIWTQLFKCLHMVLYT